MTDELCPHCLGAGGRYWRHESPPTYHACEWCLGAGRTVMCEDFDFRDMLNKKAPAVKPGRES